MDTSIFKQLIEDKFGIYIDSNRTATLEKAVEERMEQLNIVDTDTYFDLIRKKEFEFKNLVSLITVNESYFFRENRQMDLLVNTLIPEIISKKNRQSDLVILSAGCSTGEEPYSIAIAINEKFGSQLASRVKIHAFDVDKKVIETAKTGLFGKSSFRKLNEHLVDKYFDQPVTGQRQLKSSILKQVSFFEHNLLNQDFPYFIRQVDILFYRNVSIYFKPRTQKKVFEKLAEIMMTPGFLLMSATETFVHDTGVLKLIELSNCFVFKKTKPRLTTPIDDHQANNSGQSVKPVPPSAAQISNATTGKKETVPQAFLTPDAIREIDHRSCFNKSLELLRFNRHTEALELIQFIETQHPESKKLQMLKARILYHLNRIKEAKAICLGLIESDQWYVWPYLYLGFFAAIDHQGNELLKQLKKAIYISPTCWLAHYYLAKHYYSVSSFQSAAREMRNVIRLLEKNKTVSDDRELFPEPIAIEKVLPEFKQKLEGIDSRRE